MSDQSQDVGDLQREVERLRGWVREIQYDSEGHHDGERSHALAHALAVEIPYLCDEALDGKPLPQLTHDRVPVCTSTGEVGCLDCTEGICDGMTVYDWRTFCACGGDDVYGEMHHFEGCALCVPDDED